MAELNTEEKLEFLRLQNQQLNERLINIEHFLQLKFNVQPVYGEGQQQKSSNPTRKESAEGPIVTSESDFL